MDPTQDVAQQFSTTPSGINPAVMNFRFDPSQANIPSSPSDINMPQPAQTHSAGGLGGWLERNAQTIGGILGGIGGELVDPFGGGVIGAGLGQGLGQEIKNTTTGTKTNPFEEGALGAVSQLGGDVLGAGLSKVAGKVGDVAGNYGLNLLSQVGGTVNKFTAKNLKAVETTKALSDLGFNPKEFGDVSQKVMNILTPLVRKGAASAGKVDTTGLMDTVNGLIDNEMGIDGLAADKGTQANKLSGIVKSMVDKLNGTQDTSLPALTQGNIPTDILNPGAEPSDTLGMIKELGKKAANEKNPAVKSIYHQTQNELEDRLYTDGDIQLANGQIVKGAGADKSVAGGLVSDNVIQALKDIDPSNKKLGAWAEGLQNLGSLGDLRSAQAPFVRASQLADEKAASRLSQGATNNSTVKQLLGIGGVVAAPFTGGMSAAIPGAELALGTDTGKTVVGNTLRKVGSKLSNGAAPDTIKDFISGSATNRGANKISQVVKTALSQSFPEMVTGQRATQNTINGGPISSMVDNQVNQIVQNLNQHTNSTTQNFAQLVQQVGLRGAEDYMNYVKMNEPELTQTQQTQIMDATKALQEIQSLSKQFEKVGTTGAGVGQLKELGTQIPGIQNLGSESSLKAYEDAMGNVADTIASVLGTGRSSATLLNQIRSNMPSITDSPQAAQLKFSQLIQQLNGVIQSTLTAPALNVPGQLSNFAGQSVPGLNNTSSLIMPPNMSFATQ